MADLARTILTDHATNERLKALARERRSARPAISGAPRRRRPARRGHPRRRSAAADLGFHGALPAASRDRTNGGPGARPSPRSCSARCRSRGSATTPEARVAARHRHRGSHPHRGTDELDSSNPLAPATRAEAVGEDVHLTGVKRIVPCAEQASHILVPARCDDDRSVSSSSSPAAPASGSPRRTRRMGSRWPSSSSRRAGPERPGSAGPRDGAAALRWLVQRAIAARCMMQLGVIERALEMTAEYGRTAHPVRSPARQPPGVPPAGGRRLHQRRSRAPERARSRLAAVPRPARDEHVAVAKFWAAEGGQSASFACQHLHGGIGIDVDYPLHRHFNWAIQIEHELGSAKHHLERLGERSRRTGCRRRELRMRYVKADGYAATKHQEEQVLSVPGEPGKA